MEIYTKVEMFRGLLQEVTPMLECPDVCDTADEEDWDYHGAYKIFVHNLPVTHDEKVRDLICAAFFAVEQIEQMKDMFDDEDGLIQQSIDGVEEAARGVRKKRHIEEPENGRGSNDGNL